MDIVSFFSGAGGLDTGFEQAGFNTIWANEFDKNITPTFRKNFPDTELDDRSLFKVESKDIPDGAVGFIGGPPCGSWSLGGVGRGLDDARGAVFLEYIRAIKDKQPLFFVAENVKGMLAASRKPGLDKILEAFDDLGYNVTYHLVNAHDYGTPQDRWRVIFVGYRQDTGKEFVVPQHVTPRPTLRDAIWDLRDNAVPAGEETAILNHEFAVGSYSPQYMSRNRVRLWDEPSFTIQASARQAPQHPDAGRMVKVTNDVQRFADVEKSRRLTVREAARIQTFPDSHEFVYNRIDIGYKMVGNAVPVNLAHAYATQIRSDLGL